MHWIALLFALLPLLQTAIEGLPVRVDYDESEDEWDDDFEGDFEGPSYDDPKQYMRKRNTKSADSLWKVNMNNTSKCAVKISECVLIVGDNLSRQQIFARVLNQEIRAHALPINSFMNSLFFSFS